MESNLMITQAGVQDAAEILALQKLAYHNEARAIEQEFPAAARFELFTGHKSARNLYLYQKLGYRIFHRTTQTAKVDLVYLQKFNPMAGGGHA